MLLMMVVLLAFSSAFLEIRLAKAIPLWHTWSVRSTAFNIVGSVALSYLLGMMFGATGLVALMAGIVSTVITQPYYSALQYKENNEEKVQKRVQEAKDAGLGLWSLVQFIGLPFRFVRFVTRLLTNRGQAIRAQGGH